MDVLTALKQSRAGGAILFCGAGFTADSLRFETPDTLGVSIHLRDRINAKLEELGEAHNFKGLETAASRLKKRAGEHGLLNLLRDTFAISNVPEKLVEIMRFPWERVYTTNYDSGIEIACHRAARKFATYNNTEESAGEAHLEIVHLHGHIEKWDINNFSASCILDVASYARLPNVRKWLTRLRFDLERAPAVFFCGFSANDFHLNEELFNVTGLKKKSFFINRETPERDEDAYEKQDLFGTPLYIGLSEFARLAVEALADPEPKPLRLSSFQRYKPTLPATSIPTNDQLKKLLCFGERVSGQCARDLYLKQSEYHLLRESISTVQALVDEENCRIVLISGEVCDGKTIIAEDLAQLYSATRPTFWLSQVYDDILDEVAAILSRHQDAVLVIENCFELRAERLRMLASSFDASSALLILTARSIAADAETGKVSSLKPFSSFREFRLTALTDQEVANLERLIDQIAGFSHLGSKSVEERCKYIKKHCNSSLPAVLLDVLKNPQVRARYKEQINKLETVGSAARQALVACLYAKHIGDPPPLPFISNIFRIDLGRLIAEANQGNASFNLLRIKHGMVDTVPAIGASVILREFFPAKEIVDAVVFVLEEMASLSVRETEYERYIFSQMMRYSRLSTVVSDKSEIERFFDHISKIDFFRQEPLFWLQWHMAKIADEKYVDAEIVLNRGYAEAGNWEKRRGVTYNRKQLDDRKAKFLMQRALSVSRTPNEISRDVREATDILGKLLNSAEVTHHPYETFDLVLQVFETRLSDVNSALRSALSRQLSSLFLKAKERISRVPEGYQRRKAEVATADIERRLTALH